MINIVYVDDEIFSMRDGTKEDVKDLLESDLEGVSDEFELFLFDKVDEGMECIKSLGYNTIVILDMQMPIMTGADFLRNLRDQKITIPVIVYTADNDNDDMYMDLMQNDIFSYIKKAKQDYSNLIEAINKAIEKFKDIIPLELSEALHEYLKRHPNHKDIKLFSSSSQESTTLAKIEEAINKQSIDGINYAKILYKMSFEDLIREKKKL